MAGSRVRRRPLRAELARRWPELDEEAVDLIRSGAVVVDGIARTKPDSVVAETSSIKVVGERARLRGYDKLLSAFELFSVDVRGAVALDAGAAAGGFTSALLDRGARRVYAVEVGHGQLLGRLRQDDRVVSLERTNVSALTEQLVPDPLDVVTLDLGYLALATAVPELGALTFAPGARLVALVKPMAELHLGVLPTEDRDVDRAIDLAASAIAKAGWTVTGTARSPILGSRGAREGFVVATRVASASRRVHNRPNER